MIINERNHIASKLVVGIKDKTGETNALSYSEVQETTNLLSDIASENVVPSILIKIDTIEVENGNLVFATVKEGWRKRSIPTHSEWLYPLTFDAGKGLKEA